MIAAAASAVLAIVRPGMLTTVQDLGRPGLGAFGVSPAGAMDPLAHRLANALCGNPENAAALEITGPGTELAFLAAHGFSISGADLGATLDGVPLSVPCIGVAGAGARLAFTARKLGARVSLALVGGLASPRVFGSAATDLAGGLGAGVLRAGITLAIADPRRPSSSSPSLSPRLRTALARFAPAARFADRVHRLRYVVDPSGGAPAEAHAALAKRSFRLSARSNRTGFRWEGQPLPVRPDPNRLSEPTAPGAIQLPPDGLPILLMADRNTTGGYPRLGHLISADRAAAAQLWPGDEIAFVAVTLATAIAAARRSENDLRRALALIARWSPFGPAR
jgi:biotin-dependent carboxylase-like uncharacterized protein